MVDHPATRDLPLFEAYPSLAGAVPFVPLVRAPTPVRLLEKVSRCLGREIWIKRDDLSSPLYGGNKPRKLEFILADARARGKTRLVTGGGLGTNHGLATLLFGRSLGFDVTLLLFDQPVTGHVQQSLRLFQAHGATLRYAGGLYRYIWRFYLSERLRSAGAYFVEPGGSSVIGTLGYVDAGLEIAGQVRRGEMPEPAVAYVAAGTCGTMAGLVLGFKLAGLKTRVLGVRVATPLSSNARTAARLANNALTLLRRHGARIPAMDVGPGETRVDPDHFGPGYGQATEEGRQARDLMAEEEDLVLDHTYTAKAFAAVRLHCLRNVAEGPVLFINTFNSVDLSPQARTVDPSTLPPEFHRFFPEPD